jgi:hypothetical protein
VRRPVAKSVTLAAEPALPRTSLIFPAKGCETSRSPPGASTMKRAPATRA